MNNVQKIRCAIVITGSAYMAACSPHRDSQPIHDSVLPIRIGVYADTSQSCADPANAGILSFDGEGLNGAHTHDCHMKISSQQGKVFDYAQQCVDAGVGDGPIYTESGSLSVESKERFVLQSENGDQFFEYCEPSVLPRGITVPKAK